jgi:Ser/Thr protein kinase RdoA (MazF antagonist)
MTAEGRRTVLTLPDGVAAAWDLQPGTVAEPLGGGYHNTLLRVDDVVVKIEERSAESVAWEHELLAWLAPQLPEALQPFRSRDGATYRVVGHTIVSLLPYVEGTHDPSPDMPDVLARLHRRGAAWPDARPRPGRPAYADLDWERNDWWDWSAIAEKPPELVRAFEHAGAWVASAPLVVTPVHGDIAPQNVLTRNGRVVALIDWEYARLDWPALELANAAWTYSEDDPQQFVAAYVAAGGPGEPQVLQEGVRIRLVANVLYSLTHGASNHDWIAYLLARLRELQ